jgi:hypothetical protein
MRHILRGAGECRMDRRWISERTGNEIDKKKFSKFVG